MPTIDELREQVEQWRTDAANQAEESEGRKRYWEERVPLATTRREKQDFKAQVVAASIGMHRAASERDAYARVLRAMEGR